MAYIYLDDLKNILPGILDSWIDEDDESWEWIFSEIEQKCYVGKKDKKKWKNKIESMVVAHSTIISAHRNDINELTKKVDELNRIVMEMRKDVEIAKTLANIAKQRTEVDYSKYSGKSDGKISVKTTLLKEQKDCKTCKYYCGEEAINEPCIACDAYQCWEAKDE